MMENYLLILDLFEMCTPKLYRSYADDEITTSGSEDKKSTLNTTYR
jgi:hypothetical protein